ncbi:DUF1642 domain-containing protein [Enterococcus faecalis]|uniref:DUF1642 domain-containing protein n=1 Tax=Enterococcus TaxID=1350 RepID=UPI001FF09886|nr:DUF1642 domain-containing protein [Enterococcus faecalis]MDQ6205731.1 DUF1642 domain-containing protein [Enterococcus faecalis]MDT2139233.1 DUF1642 domain-containing protein [Enterococcus faecalis]DAY50435.1 MAG TPA: Protein of unknown function (DUF1642) [Caudoviricetes sp.]
MNKQELIGILEGLEGDSFIEKYNEGYDQAVRDCLIAAKQLDEPKKVVVPPIIDKFIRANIDPIYEICAWSDHYGSDGRTCEDSKLSAVINWYGKNSNEFYRAVINGYEVKEEPLYAVKGLTDYFRYGNEVILFNDKQEALDIANKIGEYCDIEEFDYVNNSNFILSREF